MAKIRAKDAKSVLTCSGEFNSRHIVRHSGSKALDDPKSLIDPRSGGITQASSATDRPKFHVKGHQRGWEPAIFPGRMQNGEIQSADQFRPWTDADYGGDLSLGFCYARGDIAALIVVCSTRLTVCLGICVLRASACGLPI
ncbi:unnamed protein product [Brassica napus]|nr:unnamed protein product [Brassica napus]